MIDLIRQDETIRATFTTRIPRRHVIIDTETRSHKHRDVTHEKWALGCWCLLDYRSNTGARRGGVKHATFPGDMWQVIGDACHTGERTVLWAHNLGFDLRASAAFIHLPRAGWHLDGAVLERQAAWCSWKRDGATLLMCDLHSWLPCPLSDIAKDLGTTQVTLDADNPLARCSRDVAITATAVDTILTHLWELEFGVFRPTGSGMSFSAFKARHLTHEIRSHGDGTALERERRAMWTGRCEAWRWGNLDGAGAFEYDMESAYGHIGKELEVPTRLLAKRGCASVRTFRQVSESHRVLCNVSVTSEVPAVPYERGRNIVWPTGYFHTTLWDTEVNLALKECNHVEITSMWIYRRDPALRSFCTWCLDQLALPPDALHPLWRRVVKLWSRSLIGRLALRYREWEPIGVAPNTDCYISTIVDRDLGSQTSMMHVGTDVFQLTDMHEGFGSAPMVTGYVMSECRVRLWNIMRIAGLQNVIYIDTDGLLVNATGHAHLSRAIERGEAHSLRYKTHYSTVDIRGPRNVHLGNTRKVSGVPKRARRKTVGTYFGQVWRGVTDSLARGEADSVAITERTFEVKDRDTRRRHLPHGKTEPFNIGGSDA